MITDGTKWHYLAISNLSPLLERKSSNHHGYFYCINCFNSSTKENKLKEHEEIFNNHNSCRTQMSNCFEKILIYNLREKPLKALFASYLDLEGLLKKEQRKRTKEQNQKNKKTEKSYTEKKSSMSLQAGQCLQNVHLIKKKLDYYRGKDCIEKVCKKLKEHAMEIIAYEKNK